MENKFMLETPELISGFDQYYLKDSEEEEI